MTFDREEPTANTDGGEMRAALKVAQAAIPNKSVWQRERSGELLKWPPIRRPVSRAVAKGAVQEIEKLTVTR